MGLTEIKSYPYLHGAVQSCAELVELSGFEILTTTMAFARHSTRNQRNVTENQCFLLGQTLQKPYKQKTNVFSGFQDLAGGGWQNHESPQKHCFLVRMVSGGSGLAANIVFP